MSGGHDRVTEIGLLALTVIWGVNYSVLKAVLDTLDPLALNALRFPLAAALLAVMVRRRPGLSVEPRDRLPLFLLGILGNVVYQMAFILGIESTLAGNASLLLATSPVWTVLLSAALGHEAPNALVFVGSAVTLGGMTLVVMGGGHALGMGRSTLKGDGLLAVAAVLWACYTVASGRYVRRYGATRVTAWTIWVGTPFLMLLGVSSLGALSWASVSPWVWAGVAYAGVFAIGTAYLLWNRGVRKLGNSRTAIYSNLVPVVALITAWLWLGEVPTVLQATGAAVVLGGITLARVGTLRRHAPGLSSSR